MQIERQSGITLPPMNRSSAVAPSSRVYQIGIETLFTNRRFEANPTNVGDTQIVLEEDDCKCNLFKAVVFTGLGTGLSLAATQVSPFIAVPAGFVISAATSVSLLINKRPFWCLTPYTNYRSAQ